VFFQNAEAAHQENFEIGEQLAVHPVHHVNVLLLQ
jgi:hypothetical protein